MKLLVFSEDNEWEGETWNFFFWITEEDEKRLREVITRVNTEKDEYTYFLENEEFTVEAVARLLKKRSSTSYLKEYTFCGEFEFHESLNKDDPFYKGGIKAFCKQLSKEDERNILK